MISAVDLGWIAALLEGEGYFSSAGGRIACPSVRLAMCDRDVVERAQRLMGSGRVRHAPQKPPRQDKYITQADGKVAAGIMMTVYREMGRRRRARIRAVLAQWRASEMAPKGLAPICHPDRKNVGRRQCRACWKRARRRPGWKPIAQYVGRKCGPNRRAA